jgi:phospholipid/cholesterol/gamma-HCH transport system substrate-binding protein
MRSEAILGMFVVVVVIVFLLFTINMGSNLLTQNYIEYNVVFKSIGTLEKGALVKQAGLDVGEVIGLSKEIIQGPTPTINIVARIRVNEEDAFVSVDSKASIQTIGMMGEKYLEVSFGSVQKAPEGSTIQGQGPFELDQIMKSASQLSEELQKTVRSFNDLLGDPKVKKSMTNTLENLEGITSKLEDFLGGEEDNLKDTLQNTKVASANLIHLIATVEVFVNETKLFLKDIQPGFTETVNNTASFTKTMKDEVGSTIAEISTQFKEVSSKLHDSIERTDKMLAKVDTLLNDKTPDIKETINNIKDFSAQAKSASERIDAILHEVQEGQGLTHDLIYDKEFSQSAKEVISDASQFMGTANSFTDRFTFELAASYYPNQVRFNQNDNNFRVDFGIEYEFNKELYAFVGGNNIGSSNQFEAQLGYRIWQFAFHGGMIESEFGIGVDWNPFERLTIGVEGVGLTRNNRERLDVYSSILLYENIYLIGGAQDVTDEVFPHVGMKVRF